MKERWKEVLKGGVILLGLLALSLGTMAQDGRMKSYASTCPTITLSPGMLPNANLGAAYSQTLTALGGTAPYGYAVTSGSLPPGLSLTTGGVLSGVPTTSGSYVFTVTATDANGCTGSLVYYLTVPLAGQKQGGGLYWSWKWPAGAAYDIQQLDMDLSILMDPNTTDNLFFSTELNCGTPALKSHFYYGLQINLEGKGKGLIFSIFGTTDLSNCRTAGGSWAVAGTNEGPFISIRRLLNWTTHRYFLRLIASPSEDDAVGRWFNFYAIETDTGDQTYVGALRFPKDANGQYPSIMTDGFGSWIEHPHLVSSPSEVPLWNVAIGRPVANGGTYLAQSANWWFGPPTDYWQNSDIWTVGESINARLGDDTQRTHGESGSIVYLNISTLVKMGSPFRIAVNGSNLQNGIKVTINNSAAQWSPVAWKSATKIILKGGAALKAAVPKGTPTNFTFVNPDGGSAIVTGWSW